MTQLLSRHWLHSTWLLPALPAQQVYCDQTVAATSSVAYATNATAESAASVATARLLHLLLGRSCTQIVI